MATLLSQQLVPTAFFQSHPSTKASPRQPPLLVPRPRPLHRPPPVSRAAGQGVNLDPRELESELGEGGPNGGAQKWAQTNTGVDISEGGGKFVWEQNWYPVVLERDLDKRIPYGATILGRPIVLWWDANASSEGSGADQSSGGSWRAFWDTCPHRLAPLSEGRIDENGHLQCAYHGWSFSGSGGCENIPQAEKPEARLSKRACARAFPCVARQGQVWVWPDDKTADLALRTPPPTNRMLEDPAFTYEMAMREFPFGYEMLVENLLDASHVPFAHHGLQGNRSQGKPLPTELVEESSRGFVGKQRGSPWTFTAPGHISTSFMLPQKNEDKEAGRPPKEVGLVFYLVPVAPGRSRLFFSFPQNITSLRYKLLPRWIEHIQRMPVLDSDLVILYTEERRLAAQGQEKVDPARAFYLPATCDRFVFAFRTWLNKHGGGRPDFGGGMDPRLPPAGASRAELMDRYTGHVRHCKSCSGALSAIQNLKRTCGFLSVAIVALVSALTAGSQPGVESFGPHLLLFALGLAGAAAGLHGLSKKFFFQDYVHALVK